MANILGINLSELRPTAIWEKITTFLNSAEGHYLVTPNPEIILASHHDEELFFILNQADLAIADGFGLKIAARLLYGKIWRLTGADLSLKLLQKAEEEKIRTVILNWRDGLSSQTEITSVLQQKYPNLDFLVLAIDRSVTLSEQENKTINDFAPGLIFVATGCPYQEKVIYHNLKKWPTVRLALGIGGAFDFITNKIKRAPVWLRTLGLEWLWRLIKQPRRLKRIYNATFVFLSKVLKVRFINPYFYRPNVACWLYKKENGQIKVLILERRDEANHWQLPQGGLDHEAVAVAAARELAEETNAQNISQRAIFKDVYRYDFPKTNRRRGDHHPRLESRRFQSDYRGQKQSLFVAEYLGSDSEIRTNYWDHRAWQWISPDRLVEVSHISRKEASRIFLEKFQSLNIN